MSKVSDLGGIGHAVKWLAIFALAYVALPQLIQLLNDESFLGANRNAQLGTAYDPNAALNYVEAQSVLRAGGY